MKYDKFLAFSLLKPAQYEQIEQYFSPADESSLFKNVPMHLVDEIKTVAQLLKKSNQRVVTKFRGPRHDAMRCTCLKQHARSVAFYLYENS